jgi:hypothetical protein
MNLPLQKWILFNVLFFDFLCMSRSRSAGSSQIPLAPFDKGGITAALMLAGILPRDACRMTLCFRGEIGMLKFQLCIAINNYNKLFYAYYANLK